MDVMDFTASHPDFDETVVETKLTRALAGETERFDWTIEHKNGSQRWVEVVLKTATIRDDQRILAVVRDISGRKEYEQALEAAEARFRALTENASFAVVTIDESSTIQYTNDAVEELFGHQPEALVGAPLTTLMPERFRDMHYAGFERYLSEGTRAIDWDGIELPGLHADGHEFPMEITFGEFAVDDEHLFTGILRDITERKRQEDAVETLHESTRELIQEPDRERVAETAITTVRTVLDRPICAIWLHEPADDQLAPVAVSDEATELFDSIPTYSADDPSLTWQAFQNGEIRVCDDLSAVEDAFNPDTPARSEMILPLGDHGVMTIGSTDVDAFTDADRSLATLLATNTEVALERANREQALSRQNDRLEFLNSLLRHHILNGMTVIQGQTDILADETGDDVKPHVETIRSRNRDIVDLVQRVRALLDVLTSEETASLEPTDLSATLEGELERLRDTYPAVEFEASIPPDVTVTANDSLAEVLGSVLTNGVDHNESDTPRVTVTVTERSEQVRVRIADNGSGVPDGLKESIFRREEIGHVKSSDSDFGLFFAETMLSEYGGDIRVEDNDPAGAVFVIDLLRP
jgi:PAS domain S-box-containing protein